MRKWVWLCLILFSLAGCGGKHMALDPTKQSDKELYEMGQNALAKKDYAKAREAFKVVFDSFPKSDYRILAKIGYADSYYKDGGDANWLLAIQEYQDFISLFPFHAKAEYAQSQIGMSYFQMREKPDRDQTNTKKAMEEFRKVIDNYPNGQSYQASYQKLVECYSQLALHDYMIARFYERTGRMGACVDRMKGLMKSYPESAYKPEYYLLIGKCLEDLDQGTEACTYYTKIGEKWGNSEFASKAKSGAARTCKN